MTVRLIPGDCIRAMRLMAALGIQVDSIVCDPPYHLTSVTSRAASTPIKDRDGAYARQIKGFMGKKWDGGDIAFKPETWALAMAVLKPGGHLLAFGGTRGWHRMAVAIEDAGFEIRDTVAWLYGSGFPKSHDVSKGIDKRPGVRSHKEFATDLAAARKAANLSRADVSELVVGSRSGACWNWEHHQFPEFRHWQKIKECLPTIQNRWAVVLEEAERDVKERSANGIAGGTGAHAGAENAYGFAKEFDITASATPEAAQWDGWGTALKPAFEPIVLARKPLGEKSVAANVLAHGTGAINVGACRVEGEKPLRETTDGKEGMFGMGSRLAIGTTDEGRWPANVCHDGSEEVEAAFAAHADTMHSAGAERSGRFGGEYQATSYDMGGPREMGRFGDNGTAARFFYSAKAGPGDRFGSKHPTVKPVSLMRWLVRMITPPGGLVLDPFAGSGSTGIAAIAEGMRAILIEADPEHQADIREHLAWATGEGRHALSSKARNKEGAKHDDLPLFKKC